MEFIKGENDLKSSDEITAPPLNSFVLPFYLTGSPTLETPKIRGRICRLVKPVTQILNRHNYPYPINSILAEAMVVTSCLSTTFKLDGIITLQAKGDGPLTTLFCDVTNEGDLRSYAAYDEKAFKQKQFLQNDELTTLMADGYMAFTIEQSGPSKRYQGIVELSGKTVADSVTVWFKNSEQIYTELITSVKKVGDLWVAATLLIQKIADEGGVENRVPDYDIEVWNNAKMFAQTITKEELIDPKLKLEVILFRLFNELGVYIQSPRFINDRCRCNNEKVETILRSIDKDELVNLTDENDNLVVDCEFCKKRRVFSSSLRSH